MAYTNGGQTIDKSMNGLLNFTGDSVTADNIICNTLDVNSSATFDGTATFNNNLPTSTITTTTSNSQFITKAIGDVLYAGGSLLPSNNIWTGTNRFDAELKTTGNTLIDPTNGLQFDTSNNAAYGISRNTTTNNMLIYNTNNTGTIEFAVGGLSIIKMSKVFPTGALSEILMTGGTLRVKTIDAYASGAGTVFSDTVSAYSSIGFGNQPSFIKAICPIATEGDVTFENTLTTATLRKWAFNFDSVTKFKITPTLSTFYDAVTFTTVPTSTATGTPTDTQIAPVAMLNNLYARLSTVANAFTNNNSFNSLLPTSTLTGTPTGTQIAPVAMLNNLYQTIVTGGFARLSTAANAFINNNSFNSFLPTSTLTGTPTATQIAPVAMLDNLYAGLSTINSFINNNTFGGTNTIINSTTTNINGTCVVKGAQTGSILDSQMSIINSVTPNPNSINFACNLSAGNYNPIVVTGDSAIFSGQTVGVSRLVLTTHSNSSNGIRIDGSNNDVTIYGTVTTLAGTTNNVNGFNTFIAPTSALQISAPTTNIYGTNVNINPTGTLAFGNTVTTTFVNLPSTTTTFTTATANQFITKNIGDTLYIPSGGYARLTAVDNSFTNNNAFNTNLPTSTLTGTPTGTQIAPVAMLNNLYASAVSGGYAKLTVSNTFSGAGVTNNFQGSSVTLASVNNIVQAQVATATIDPTLTIRTSDNIRSIKFIAYASVTALNPAVIANSAVIAGSGTLVLTAQSAGTAVGISINDIGYVRVAGQVMEVNTVTNSFLNPIKFIYTTTPTFVDFQIGYNIAPVGTSIYAPTANQLYQGNTFTLTRGVWLVKGFTAIYSSINQARVYMSLTTSTLSHDVGNRTFCYNNAATITTNSFELTKVVVVPTAGQTFYLLVSSNLATTINPTYFVSYEATRIA